VKPESPSPNDLYRRCRTVLLKCNEFDNDTTLRTIFITKELDPLRDRLPEATNRSRRVDAVLDYLLTMRLSDGHPALLPFLQVLNERYYRGDALRDELETLRIALGDLPPDSAIYSIAKRRRFWMELGRLKLALLILALLVISAVFSLFCIWSVTWLTREDRRVYDVQIEGQDRNIIVAHNQQGSPIWQVKVDSRVIEVVVDDIDQDGKQEVIAATQEPGARPGWLLVFDATGKLMAEHNTWKKVIYAGGASDQFNVTDFLVTDLTGDGNKEIVAVSQDVYWYASRLVAVRFQGEKFREMSEYWNPGLLNTVDAADINGDGIQEIVCTGENNDLQAVYPIRGNMPVVFALEGSKIAGQAPPWFGDAPEGTELWYAYAPPPSIHIAEVGFVDADEDGVIEFHITLAGNCSWYLDLKGNIVKRGIGTGCTDDVELIFVTQGQGD